MTSKSRIVPSLSRLRKGLIAPAAGVIHGLFGLATDGFGLSAELVDGASLRACRLVPAAARIPPTTRASAAAAIRLQKNVAPH